MDDSFENTAQDEIPFQKKGRFLHVLLLLSCVCLLGFLAHTWRSKQPVAEITVHGVEAMTEEEILVNLDSSLKTQPVENIQLASVRSKIKQNLLVKNAVVERRGVRGIEVSVEERLPLAAIIDRSGTIVFVDDEGVLLPYSRYNVRTDVPLFRGLTENGVTDTAVLKNSIEILKNINANNDKSLVQTISEIQFNRVLKTYSIMSDSGVEILLGNESHLPTSIKKLSGIFKSSVIAKDAMNELEYIDLRWQGRIITSGKKNS